MNNKLFKTKNSTTNSLHFNARKKLLVFIIIVIVLSALTLSCAIVTAILGFYAAINNQWMTDKQLFNITIVFAILDIVFVCFWIACMIITIINGHKINHENHTKGLNISYLVLLCVFIVLGIVAIILTCLNFGYITASTRYSNIISVSCIEIVRGLIILAILILSIIYYRLVRKNA